MTKGKFIVLDGIDGSGTTTHTRLLAEKLTKEYGVETICTNEPTSTPIGKFIRSLFTDKSAVLPDWKTMAALFTADRIYHNKEVIEPAIAAGKIVICDRYYYSTMAYQSYYALQENYKWWWENIHTLNTLVVVPDLVLILDIDVNESLRRVIKRGNIDKFEENIKLQNYLVDFYRNIDTYVINENIRHIDVSGNKEKEDVAQCVFNEVKTLFAGV